MPAITSLAFYREKQTIDVFDKERPKSLPAFRTAIRHSLDEVLADLQLLERDYLHPFNSHDDYIQEHMMGIKLLLQATNTSVMCCKTDFEVVQDKVNYLGEKAPLYKATAANLKVLGQHVQTFTPPAFQPLMEKLHKVLGLMEKYCLSFYTGPQVSCPDPYLETPFQYEQKRKIKIEDVKQSLKQIDEICQKFNSIGVKLEHFSMKTEQLARRCNCRNVLFFLLFPQSAEKIHDSCEILFSWLEEDKEYVEGLTNDLKSMHSDEEEQSQERLKIYNEMVRTRHQLELDGREHDQTDKMLAELFGRKKQVEEEYHLTLMEYKKAESLIYKSKYRLDEVRDNVTRYSRSEFLKQIREQKKMLVQSKSLLPSKLKLVNRVEEKMNWFKAKEEHMNELKQARAKGQRELARLTEQLSVCDRNLNHLQKMKVVVRNVFNLKTDPGTMKKLFHNLQLESRLKFLNSSRDNTPEDIKQFLPQDDNLSVAIRFAAHFIENDWFRLYFALPFHPMRGRADVEQDIDRINRTNVRGSLFELALEALNLWRRLHIRANLTGLLEALRDIDRSDIVDKIQTRLARLKKEAQGFVIAKRPSLSPMSRLFLRQKTMPLMTAASQPEPTTMGMGARSVTSLPMLS